MWAGGGGRVNFLQAMDRTILEQHYGYKIIFCSVN